MIFLDYFLDLRFDSIFIKKMKELLWQKMQLLLAVPVESVKLWL